MEYTRAKWTHYGGHIANVKEEHNSTQIIYYSNVFGGPLQCESFKVHCTMKPQRMRLKLCLLILIIFKIN